MGSILYTNILRKGLNDPTKEEKLRALAGKIFADTTQRETANRVLDCIKAGDKTGARLLAPCIFSHDNGSIYLREEVFGKSRKVFKNVLRIIQSDKSNPPVKEASPTVPLQKQTIITQKGSTRVTLEEARNKGLSNELTRMLVSGKLDHHFGSTSKKPSRKKGFNRGAPLE